MTSQELTKTTYDNFSTKNWSTTKIQVKHNIIQCNQSKQHQFIVANDNADSNYIPEFKIYIYSKTIIILTTCHKYKEQSKIKQYIIHLCIKKLVMKWVRKNINYNYFPQADQFNKEEMVRIRKNVKNILFRKSPAKNLRSQRIKLKTKDFMLEKEIPTHFKDEWKKYLNRRPVKNDRMKEKALKIVMSWK